MDELFPIPEPVRSGIGSFSNEHMHYSRSQEFRLNIF